MIRDPTLRNHSFPVRHTGVVSEGEDSCRRDPGWEEGLGPWLGFVVGGPGLLAVARQAVDEDNPGMNRC